MTAGYDPEIIEIFATNEQAHEYLELLCKSEKERNGYCIQEYDVETDVKKVIRQREELIKTWDKQRKETEKNYKRRQKEFDKKQKSEKIG